MRNQISNLFFKNTMNLKEQKYWVIIKMWDKQYMNIEYKEWWVRWEGVYEGIPIRLNDNGKYELRYAGIKHCHKNSRAIEWHWFNEKDLKEIYNSEIWYIERVNSLCWEFPKKIKENEEKIKYIKENFIDKL